MKTKIKICGTTNLNDALFCEQRGADALGFIFHKPSKRYIEPEKAAEIISLLNPFTTPVGVFVNSEVDEILSIIKMTGIRVVQLHGDEPAGYLTGTGCKVIKAYRVNRNFNFASISGIEGETPLFDTFTPDKYGGSGLQFDYTRIPENVRSRSIIAGGISSENVIDVLKLHPLGIDLVSHLEEYPGKKDYTKTELFFHKIQQFQAAL